MKAIITVGVSGCGKTTWAHEQRGFRVISRDDFRVSIHNEETNGATQFTWKAWKWSKEKEVTERVNLAIEQAVADNKDIIIADTNLNQDRMQALVAKLETMGYDVSVKYFHGLLSKDDISIETCLKRDSQRSLSVGFDVIHKQWKQMHDSYGWIVRNQYSGTMYAPDTVVVDIDGTVADHSGVRGPFEWDKVGLDNQIKHVVEIVKLLALSGKKIVFVSGRDGCCEQQTRQWLHDICFDYADLFMRTPGDCRSDDIVKEEIFWTFVAPNYNVLYVIDDRKKMVQRWTDMGIKVINVGHINEYF